MTSSIIHYKKETCDKEWRRGQDSDSVGGVMLLSLWIFVWTDRLWNNSTRLRWYSLSRWIRRLWRLWHVVINVSGRIHAWSLMICCCSSFVVFVVRGKTRCLIDESGVNEEKKIRSTFFSTILDWWKWKSLRFHRVCDLCFITSSPELSGELISCWTVIFLRNYASIIFGEKIYIT